MPPKPNNNRGWFHNMRNNQNRQAANQEAQEEFRGDDPNHEDLPLDDFDAAVLRQFQRPQLQQQRPQPGFDNVEDLIFGMAGVDPRQRQQQQQQPQQDQRRPLRMDNAEDLIFGLAGIDPRQQQQQQQPQLDPNRFLAARNRNQYEEGRNNNNDNVQEQQEILERRAENFLVVEFEDEARYYHQERGQQEFDEEPVELANLRQARRQRVQEMEANYEEPLPPENNNNNNNNDIPLQARPNARARRGGPIARPARPAGDPDGPIRRGNGQLATSSRWIFTIRLREVDQIMREDPPNIIIAEYDDENYVYDIEHTWSPISMADMNNLQNRDANLVTPGPVTFISYQLERGHVGDYRSFHYQGYVAFANDINAHQVMMRMGLLLGTRYGIKIDPGDIWLSPSFGRTQLAIDYTQKDQTAVYRMNFEGERLPAMRVREGEPPQLEPGEQAEQIMRDIADGMNVMDIARLYSKYYFAHSAAINQLVLLARQCEQQTFREVEVHVLWGDTGAGKTSFVYKKHGYEHVYRKTGKDQYFDGYKKQSVLLIDEYTGESPHIKINELLEWGDGNPIWIPQKYGGVWAKWQTVYITSNKPPSSWWDLKTNPENVAAFHRRVASIVKCVDPKKIARHEQYMEDPERNKTDLTEVRIG